MDDEQQGIVNTWVAYIQQLPDVGLMGLSQRGIAEWGIVSAHQNRKLLPPQNLLVSTAQQMV